MRMSIVMLLLCAGLAGTVLAEQTVEGDSGVSNAGLLTLRYAVLSTEDPVGSSVDAAGDTITFTLFYVDTDCPDYTYQLERIDDRLAVRRVNRDSSSCDSEYDAMYGVKGTITGIEAGMYQF